MHKECICMLCTLIENPGLILCTDFADFECRAKLLDYVFRHIQYNSVTCSPKQWYFLSTFWKSNQQPALEMFCICTTVVAHANQPVSSHFLSFFSRKPYEPRHLPVSTRNQLSGKIKPASGCIIVLLHELHMHVWQLVMASPLPNITSFVHHNWN